MRSRLSFFAAAIFLTSALAAQTPPEVVPEAAGQEAETGPAREQRPPSSPSLRLDPVTHAVTPAADISAGTFGANTGGGTYTFSGRTGFGTTTPAGLLHAYNGALYFETATDSATAYGIAFRKARGTAGALSPVQSGDSVGFFGFNGWDGTIHRGAAMIRAEVDGMPSETSVPGRLLFMVSTGGTSGAVEKMRLTAAGNVGIGTTAPEKRLHVVGDAHFDGTVTGTKIKAHYQDLAEWVPANEDLPPGTVVVLDASIGNGVMASSRAYDTTVAGVVSAEPGIILGEEGASKEQIATTGRVRVKVDASRGAIAVGDILVTSDRRGYAMRSTPIDVGGALIHRPGTIVGKALEALPSGEGEILVLLSMQ